MDGTYRTLLIGGDRKARDELQLRADYAVRKFKVDHGGLQTVATTTTQGYNTAFFGSLRLGGIGGVDFSRSRVFW